MLPFPPDLPNSRTYVVITASLVVPAKAGIQTGAVSCKSPDWNGWRMPRVFCEVLR
jgi:hypothetical protein